MNLLFFAPFYPSPNLIGFPHRRRTLFPELRSPTRSLSPQVWGEEFMSYSSLRRGARGFRSHLGTGSTRQGVPVPTRFFHFYRTFVLTDL